MNTKMKIIAAIGILGLFAVWAFWWINLFKPHSQIGDTQYRYDTVYKIVRANPIVIEKVKSKVQYLHDTVYSTREFIATADTVIKLDTVKLKFSFPEKYFSMSYLPKSDSIAIQRETQIKTINKERPWWEIPLYILIGGAGGYILAK